MCSVNTRRAVLVSKQKITPTFMEKRDSGELMGSRGCDEYPPFMKNPAGIPAVRVQVLANQNSLCCRANEHKYPSFQYKKDIVDAAMLADKSEKWAIMYFGDRDGNVPSHRFCDVLLVPCLLKDDTLWAAIETEMLAKGKRCLMEPSAAEGDGWAALLGSSKAVPGKHCSC